MEEAEQTISAGKTQHYMIYMQCDVRKLIGGGPSVISHPLHISSTWTSTFIPFCAFQSNMALSKQPTYIKDLYYPLCSSFQPTLLEGQLCFKLQMNATSAEGKKNQLMLLLDYNEDRSIYAPNEIKTQRSSQNILAKTKHETLNNYLQEQHCLVDLSCS